MDASSGGPKDEREPARVSTRTGDDGFTSLLGPDRVAKYSARPSCVGTLDEASSALGLGRALTRNAQTDSVVRELQKGLYKIMAELSTPPSNYSKISFKVDSSDVARLDALLENYRSLVEVEREFVLPGDSPSGAALDVARTVVRRAERMVARLIHEGDIENRHVLEWLNRLSDVVFVMARFEDSDQPASRESEGAASNPRPTE